MVALHFVSSINNLLILSLNQRLDSPHLQTNTDLKHF